MDLAWDDLLQRVRSGADPSDFREVFPTLLNQEVISDETKLRLLGNLLANNEFNRRDFRSSGLVDKLLHNPTDLMLQVVINAVIDSPETAEYVLRRPGLPMAVGPGSEASVQLMEILFDEIEHIPRDLGRRIIDAGFVQLILIDEYFETEVLDMFDKVFRRAQELNNEQGVKIVGNICFHPQFNLTHALNVVDCPFTCETGVMLACLTAKKADIVPVLCHWPQAQFQAMALFEDISYDPPLDPKILMIFEVAVFVRNISRDGTVAAQWDPTSVTNIVKGITRSPLHAEIGWDLAANYLAHVFEPELVGFCLSTQPGPSQIMLASNAVDAGSPAEFHDLLVRKILDSLEASRDQLGPWIKGTRTLALLSRKGAHVDIDAVKALAPKNEQVQANIEAISH